MTETLEYMPPVELKSDFDFSQVAHLMEDGGMFVYEGSILLGAANRLKSLQMPYGINVRYAAKANPYQEIIELFDQEGLDFDASSVYEADYLINTGVRADKISLSSQVLRDTDLLGELVDLGIKPVATTIRQIELLNNMGCNEIAVRINPGIGSGHNNRTNVGGPSSSFGIWYEQLDEVIATAGKNGVEINRLHTHIGSGADPDIWRTVIQKSLDVAERLKDVTTLDIGGGFKTARMPRVIGLEEDKTTDMTAVAKVFAEELERFKDRTGREIKLEIEPGTYLVANAGTLLGRVEEAHVRTDRYDFLRLNVGMNALLRPSLYGALHPIVIFNTSEEYLDYVINGPCCESGDILTPAPGDPEGILPRRLLKASLDDIVAISGAGAYGKTMAAESYNKVPPATELFIP